MYVFMDIIGGLPAWKILGPRGLTHSTINRIWIMRYELVSGIPRRFWEHVVTCVYTQALEQYWIVIIFDQNGLVNFLWHVKDLDELDGPRSYLALLEEEYWSDILAPEYEEEYFPMDRQWIIRVRILGHWHGLRIHSDGRQPEFFHFGREFLYKYAIVFIYPFCEFGYARAIVMEKQTKEFSYVLFKTNGTLLAPNRFKYIMDYGSYWKAPDAALLVADNGTVVALQPDGQNFTIISEPGELSPKLEAKIRNELETIAMVHFGPPSSRKNWSESLQEIFEEFGCQASENDNQSPEISAELIVQKDED